MGRPELPCVTSPSIYLDGTVEVGVWITGSTSSAALTPVDSVDLPESNISGRVSVVVECVGISSAFVGNNAFAAILVPAILGAPGGNVLHSLGGSTVAGRASSRGTVAST